MRAAWFSPLSLKTVSRLRFAPSINRGRNLSEVTVGRTTGVTRARRKPSPPAPRSALFDKAPQLLAGSLLAEQVPGSDQNLVPGFAQAGGLDEVRPEVSVPERLVVAAKRFRGRIFIAAHGVGEQGIVRIEENRNLG